MCAITTDRFEIRYDSYGAPFLLRIHGGSFTRGATSYNDYVKVFFLHVGFCGGFQLIAEAELVLTPLGGYG
jgi:hypothetical protein